MSQILIVLLLALLNWNVADIKQEVRVLRQQCQTQIKEDSMKTSDKPKMMHDGEPITPKQSREEEAEKQSHAEQRAVQ